MMMQAVLFSMAMIMFGCGALHAALTDAEWIQNWSNADYTSQFLGRAEIRGLYGMAAISVIVLAVGILSEAFLLS